MRGLPADSTALRFFNHMLIDTRRWARAFEFGWSSVHGRDRPMLLSRCCTTGRTVGHGWARLDQHEEG